MDTLLAQLRSIPEYQALLTAIQSGSAHPALGLPRAARLPVLAALHADLGRPVVLLTDRADHALARHDELAFWLPESPRFLFQEPNPLFYEQAAWGVTTRRDRLHTLTALANYHLPFSEKPNVSPVIVTSARALMTRTIPRRDYLKACKRLKVSESYPPDGLLRSWAAIGYQRVDTVLEPGQFSHRGGLLDIWPPAEKWPARLDFFGDELDTLRRFDPASQRTVDKLDSLLVTPAREYIIGDSVTANGKSVIGNWELETPADSQSSITNYELSEFHIPVLHRYPASLLDYLPPKALVLVDDLSLVEAVVNDVEEQAVRLRQESVDEGTLAADFPVPYLTWSELADSLERTPMVEMGHSGDGGTWSVDGGEMPALGDAFEHDERFGGRLKQFMEYLGGIISKGEKAVVVSRQAPRLEELWKESREQGAENSQNPRFIESSISEGFVLKLPSTPQLSTHLISDSEIFGWERPQPRTRQRPVAEAPESAYADLRPGDYVVHVDHGIGRYVGLVQRALDGHEREFLTVVYENGDQLFVPVHQADRLTRYIGPDGGAPSLNRLGGTEWQQTRSRVKEAVQEVAEDLLDLYARRHVAQGYAFGTDTAWQAELEASFPYVETEDQLRVIADVKRDMEAPRPMDRLLCGDVGYGKTEVALRAAFKAVADGKQVAILVPTTVLAQQHYDTFQQRLAAYPVTVEMLSRFRTHREQSQILFDLALGQVDIVIGTHRLISSDVEFKDLGLVIIDEEQRFGVTHKEHLKKLRTEVDVLTLTATPIPRTLYMTLTGVRDISNLTTPPEERLPIVTHVGPYSPKLVRQAILRELERGGQVFFVHNRVQTIEAMKLHLEKLVPEARIAVGHGQMPEGALAAVMRQFNSGKVDILLSTTIIESGLDIPNANTLIVDRADTFGLAQLYQLRGRVGRGAVRAYAYFFRHRRKAPTADGQERLEVIAENTQLGAGYSIAMRDLEIRGAGDLLGVRQHGFIASVGFHLYTRLLADAVRKVRRSAVLAGRPDLAETLNVERSALNLPIAMPVNVDLPLATGIPAVYIPDQDLRLRLYRRIADLRDEAELDALAAEFRDRFGPPPEMVENLVYQMRVKLRAEKAGLASVGIETGQIVLRFPALPEGAEPKRLPDLGAGVRGGRNAYWCTFTKDEDWQERLLETLDRIGR